MDASKIQIYFLVIFFLKHQFILLFSHSCFNWKGLQMTPFLGSSRSLLLGLQEWLRRRFPQKCSSNVAVTHRMDGFGVVGWLTVSMKLIATQEYAIVNHWPLRLLSLLPTTHLHLNIIYYIANMNEKPKHMGFLSWINMTCWKETSSPSPTLPYKPSKNPTRWSQQLVLTYPPTTKSPSFWSESFHLCIFHQAIVIHRRIMLPDHWCRADKATCLAFFFGGGHHRRFFDVHLFCK